MNKKNQNLLFILLILIISAAAILFSYFNDPYNLFSKKNYMNLTGKEPKYFELYIDEYAEYKNKNLFIGDSSAAAMFCEYSFNKEFFNSILISDTNYKELYYTLKYYLNIHSETERVFFFIGYTCFFFENTNEHYNFSKSAKNKFLQKLKMLFSVNTDKTADIISKEPVLFDFPAVNIYHPYCTNDYSRYTIQQKKIEKTNLKYAAKIINMLKEKNIEYKIIIPPYNAIESAMQYLNKEYYNNIEEIKRFFVYNYGEIYDFSIINDYTSQNLLLNNSNYLYICPVHPNHFWGRKLIRSIFFNDDSLKNLYRIYNTHNIEQNLIKQRAEIEKYLSENKEYADLPYAGMIEQSNINVEKTASFNSIPENIQDDISYLYSKISRKKGI